MFSSLASSVPVMGKQKLTLFLACLSLNSDKACQLMYNNKGSMLLQQQHMIKIIALNRRTPKNPSPKIKSKKFYNTSQHSKELLRRHQGKTQQEFILYDTEQSVFIILPHSSSLMSSQYSSATSPEITEKTLGIDFFQLSHTELVLSPFLQLQYAFSETSF